MRDPRPTLILAGLSVRAAAQAAGRDGFRVIGLDAFGDADTRAACAGWTPLRLRSDVPWQLDADSLLASLGALGGQALLGLSIGSGWSAEGADLTALPVPWLGTARVDLARVRDPATFFATLAEAGIAPPPTRLTPTRQAGWLRKDFGGSGGVQVQPADRADDAAPIASSRAHWQAHLDGEPHSLTLIGNGERAAVLGLNRQRVQPAPGCAHRFGGLIGPLPWTHAEAAALQDLADRLASRFALRGLCSIDLLRVDSMRDASDAWRVLEINPRLPASLSLYGVNGGLMRAHVDACRHQRLPDAKALAHLRGEAGLGMEGGANASVRGIEIVHADRPLRLDADAVRVLHAAERAGVLHDVPCLPDPGAVVEVPAGAPLCSLSAEGDSPSAVAQRLSQRRAAWMSRLIPFIRTVPLQEPAHVL